MRRVGRRSTSLFLRFMGRKAPRGRFEGESPTSVRMGKKAMLEIGRRLQRGFLFQRSMGRKASKGDWRGKTDASDDGEKGDSQDR